MVRDRRGVPNVPLGAMIEVKTPLRGQGSLACYRLIHYSRGVSIAIICTDEQAAGRPRSGFCRTARFYNLC
jgi:hypothetical protein